MSGRKGFTLIEMVITLTIVTLLASVVFPLAKMTMQRNKEQELRTALQHIREALDAYKQAWNEGHIMHNAGESGYPKSLQTLVDGVEDAKNPGKTRIYFLRRIPRDPFNNDISLPADQTWGKRSYASSADTSMEGVDVYDVYSLAPGEGLNGIPYRNW